MNYNEFKEALKKEIEKRLERKAAVSFRTISKMNQVEKESIQIEKTGGKVSPVFSLEDLYGAYAVNEDFGKCVEEVLRIYEEESCVNEKEIPMTWEEARERIQFRLVKKVWNEEMLKRTPYQEYLDFAVVFYVSLSQTEELRATITVTREMAEMWGVTETELWEAAKKNFEKEAFFIETMESVLSELLGEEVPEIKESQQGEGILYILSNRKREYGARAVLRTGELQRLADEQKTSFYLLPSSIHEWILCKDDGETDVHMMKEIVREINEDSHIINPEECLSDSIYYYDREQNEVRIVA